MHVLSFLLTVCCILSVSVFEECFLLNVYVNGKKIIEPMIVFKDKTGVKVLYSP